MDAVWAPGPGGTRLVASGAKHAWHTLTVAEDTVTATATAAPRTPTIAVGSVQTLITTPRALSSGY